MSERRSHRRRWRWPWQPIPGDDGFLWSLRMARMICGAWLLFPLLFAGAAFAVIAVVGRPHEEPLIVAGLAVLSLLILPTAPFVRERLARVGIGAHLEGERAVRTPRAVYAGFATAAITGFMIAHVAALFGFVSTALTRQWPPLVAGSAVSYVVWWMLWPRYTVWARWTWQARLRSGDDA